MVLEGRVAGSAHPNWIPTAMDDTATIFRRGLGSSFGCSSIITIVIREA